MPSPKPLAACVDTKLESPIHPAARGKASGIVHAREAKGSRPDNPNRVSEETTHRTYKNGCPESVFRIYCARTTCVSAGSLSQTSMLTIRARVFSGLAGPIGMIIHGFRGHTHSILTFWYYYIRARARARASRVLWIRFGSLLARRPVILALLDIVFSSVALPLGRGLRLHRPRHRRPGQGAGGNHGGTPGITHFSPAGAHGHAGAGPSATQKSLTSSSHADPLYTLRLESRMTHLCHEAQPTACRGRVCRHHGRHATSYLTDSVRLSDCGVITALCCVTANHRTSHTRCRLSVHMRISLRGVIGFSSGSAASLCRCRRAIWDTPRQCHKSQRSRMLLVVSWPPARTHGRTSCPLQLLKGGEHKLGGLRGPFPFPIAVLLGHIKVELPRRR